MSQVLAKQIDGLLLVELEGEVTLEVVEAEKAAVLEIFQEAASPVMIDMSAVTFMDSGAVGFIVTLLKKAQSDNRKLALMGAEGQPRIVLGMVGIDEHVRIFDSSDKAKTFLLRNESP